MSTNDTNDQPEQLELDLEYATYDHYLVRLFKGAIGDMELVRSHSAKTVDDAYNLIDGLRELWTNRDSVTWQYEEVDADGHLYGLAPGGVVYEISVVPPLNTPLS